MSTSSTDYDYILNVLKGYYVVQEDTISIEFTDYQKDNAWIKIENAADGDLVENITNLWHSNASYSISQSGILTIDGVTCKSSFTSTESRLLGDWKPYGYSNQSFAHTFSLNSDNTYVEGNKNGTYSVITDYPDNNTYERLEVGFIIFRDETTETGITVHSFILHDYRKFRWYTTGNDPIDILFLYDDLRISNTLIKEKAEGIPDPKGGQVFGAEFNYSHVNFDYNEYEPAPSKE